MPKKSSHGSPETHPQATYQDVLDAPPHTIAEIIHGTLYLSPMLAPRQGFALTSLAGYLGPAFSRKNRSGDWWVLNKPELHLGEDILVPDIVGWRRDRMPKLPDEAYFTQAPDWACEILSQVTMTLDVGMKRAIYAREGVAHLWFVDPDARILEAFELRDGQWTLLRTLMENDTVSLPPFEAINFSLCDLWPDDGKNHPDTDEDNSHEDVNSERVFSN